MHINILTTTFYLEKGLRFHLACQLIGDAVATGYHVLILDGSPDHTVREAFRKIGADVWHQVSQGMGNSRRELFNIASEINVPEQQMIFVWTEPEKVDLIRSIPQLVAPIECGKADIVIPSRTEKSWASYPEFQVQSEKKANAVYLELIGKEFDPMFGPVAFASNAATYFANCNPAEQFEATDTYIQHFAPLTAMSKGHVVTSVAVDFFYPLAQRMEEESELHGAMLEKRQWQLNQLTTGYQLAARKLSFPVDL